MISIIALSGCAVLLQHLSVALKCCRLITIEMKILRTRLSDLNEIKPNYEMKIMQSPYSYGMIFPHERPSHLIFSSRLNFRLTHLYLFHRRLIAHSTSMFAPHDSPFYSPKALQNSKSMTKTLKFHLIRFFRYHF